MDNEDFLVCEELLKVVNDMSFMELKGKDLVSKFIVFQNFSKMIAKHKSPKTAKPSKDDKATVSKGKK